MTKPPLRADDGDGDDSGPRPRPTDRERGSAVVAFALEVVLAVAAGGVAFTVLDEVLGTTTARIQAGLATLPR